MVGSAPHAHHSHDHDHDHHHKHRAPHRHGAKLVAVQPARPLSSLLTLSLTARLGLVAMLLALVWGLLLGAMQ
jgi:hypothetical protein